MDTLARERAEQAITEYEDMTRAPWVVPRDVGIEVVISRHRAADIGLAAIQQTTDSYLGSYNTMADLARGLAVQSYPSEGEADEYKGFATVDWAAWPFNHIDWDAAGETLAMSIDTGTLIRVQGTHYFDRA